MSSPLVLHGAILFLLLNVSASPRYLSFMIIVVSILAIALSVVSHFALRNQQYKSKIEQRSLLLFYHKQKRIFLLIFFIVFTISFLFLFLIDPIDMIIPVGLLILSTLAFTIKAKGKTKKLIARKSNLLHRRPEYFRKRYSNRIKYDLDSSGAMEKNESNFSQYEDKHQRAVILISFFLMCMPLVFAVPSLLIATFPQTEFATIPQYQRVDGNEDFSSLNYTETLDDIDLTFNGKFVSRSYFSLSWGRVARMYTKIVPIKVDDIEGHELKEKYELYSNLIGGPRTNYTLITEVELDELDLLPGKYEVSNVYYVTTGFTTRYAEADKQYLELSKDNVRIEANEPFDLGDAVDYGAIYTFEDSSERCWKVVFDGKIVDSLNQGVEVAIDLFIEVDDHYEKIATVDTESDGSFYHEHVIYGSFELNTLAKIEFAGDGLYNPVSREEYAGLEYSIDGGRFFIDEDGDGYPDWPYTLDDLLDALRISDDDEDSVTPSALQFLAEFDEGSGVTTTDTQRSLEGIIEGTTNWTEGYYGSALHFDGAGEITEAETIGSTIYAAYANVSYAYSAETSVIEYQSFSIETSSSSVNGLTVTHTTPPGTNRLLVIIIGLEGDKTVSSCTYNNIECTYVTRAASGGFDGECVELWYMINPPEGSYDCEVVYSGSENPSYVATMSFQGVDQINPVGANAGAYLNFGNDISVAITPTVADSIIIGGSETHGGDIDPFSPNSGVIELYDTKTGTSSYSDAGCWGGYIEVSTLQSYDFGAQNSIYDDWAIVCAEFKPAGIGNPT
ncbi:MAG: hypothetical protein ACFFDH_23075, partial [Promethearchaeota archaeon]